MRLALFLSSLLGLSFLNAQDASGLHSALKPDHRMKTAWWKNRQEAANQKAAAKQHDILFIGDSITQGWEGAGKGTWQKFYADRNALNLGFSGDRTEHVIWRLQNGNLQNQENAKLAIIMIGTNNTGHNSQAPHETAAGIEKIISLVKEGCPKAKILLLGVFPRSVNPTDKPRLLNEVINKHISKFDDGETIHYLELDDVLLNDQGILTKEIMPDALHPKEKGYQIWAESMEPKLKELGL
ncbi:MAG: GDSL-type esterase/lipase family protein [Akkermansiaceae bacterium]